MVRPVRFVLLLVALALAATVLAACGSSSGGGGDAAAVLKDTFGPNHKVKSGDLAVAFTLDAKGLAQLKGPLALKLTGPFQSTGTGQLPKFDFSLALNASGQSITGGGVSTGDKGFVRFQDKAYAVPDAVFAQFKQGYQQAQQQNPKKGNQNTLKALGIDPANWLKDPKTQGDEDVAGTKTIHITSGIDVPKFLHDLDAIVAAPAPWARECRPSSRPSRRRRSPTRSRTRTSTSGRARRTRPCARSP